MDSEHWPAERRVEELRGALADLYRREDLMREAVRIAEALARAEKTEQREGGK